MFLKFRNIHRNTPVLEPHFNKDAGLKGCNFIKERLQHRGFPVNVALFLRKAFSWNISSGCFYKSLIIFTEVWVRTLSNIYYGAFCRNSENLSTIFTKNRISDASKKIFKVNLQHQARRNEKQYGGWAFIKIFGQLGLVRKIVQLKSLKMTRNTQ